MRMLGKATFGHGGNAAILENTLEIPQEIQDRVTISSNKSTSVFASKGINIGMSESYFYSCTH